MAVTVPVITVDGPGGAGKGTLCKALANALQWNLLDSGAIYRVLALAALHHQVDVTSEEALVPLASHLDVRFVPQQDQLQVILEGEDVSNAIRTQEVGNTASQAAVFPRVREALLRRQRAFREMPGLIADGRDMGTGGFFLDAPVKILFSMPVQRNVQNAACFSCRKKDFNVNFERFCPRLKSAMIVTVADLLRH